MEVKYMNKRAVAIKQIPVFFFGYNTWMYTIVSKEFLNNKKGKFRQFIFRCGLHTAFWCKYIQDYVD
jgi:hypothetical protein